MKKFVNQMTVDGYEAQETDFAERLSRLSPALQEQFEKFVVGPIVDTLLTEGQAAVVKIEGHSDRNDRDGLSREERRLDELEKSVDRANRAGDDLFQIVAGEFPGELNASDWAELDQVGITFSACGAAVLMESDPVLTDSQRRRNRRVDFTLVVFQPDARIPVENQSGA